MNPRAAAVLAALLVLGETKGIKFKFKPSNIHCVACGVEIPQGRAGRKCLKCRKP